VDEPLTAKEMELMWDGVYRQSPYGQAGWRITVSQELGLESTTRPQGRPKKDAASTKK
jgi:putative transposase